MEVLGLQWLIIYTCRSYVRNKINIQSSVIYYKLLNKSKRSVISLKGNFVGGTSFDLSIKMSNYEDLIKLVH